MEEKYTDNDVINMMALSEEISTLSVKVKQLIEDVHSDRPLLGTLKELTTELNKKVSELSKGVNVYKPREVLTGDPAVASYVAANLERERIFPNPDEAIPSEVINERLTTAQINAKNVPKPSKTIKPPKKATKKAPSKIAKKRKSPFGKKFGSQK